MDHIYNQPQFEVSYFTYPKFYSRIVSKFPSGGKFVEIGSWKGKSSAYMVVEIINSGKNIEFTCVDTWEGSIEHQDFPELKDLYKIFKSNMNPLEKHYTDIKMSSLEAVKFFPDKSLDFVFIDASHEYNDVKNDILAWKPKVKIGGILSGHDYWTDEHSWLDVRKAVNEILKDIEITNEGCWIHEITS